MISYRKLKHKDKKYITNYINQAWFEEENVNEKAKKLYSIGYYYMYLRLSNYVEIATNEQNECVGFVFGRGKHVNIFRYLYYTIPYLITGLRLFLFKDGRRGLKVEFKTFKINKNLRKQVKEKIEGELQLFIVNENYRKNGIGTTLQKNFIEYLKKHNSNNYSLYTDTFSNYQYYDNNGFKKVAEMEVDFGFEDQLQEDGSLPKYFIYLKSI